MTTDGGACSVPRPAVPSVPAVADPRQLITALQSLRAGLGEVRLGLPLRGAEDAQAATTGLSRQIDDYLLPRLSRPWTPPLLVIGGSTGAGKSTLLNTLVGASVSTAGVLRPTTRSPVLVCHPDDFGTFLAGGPLPALTRSADGAPGTLRILESRAVPAGLALVDAPDVDSVETGNRQLAARLLDAADLWIFVTTAARYADAVPWELLRSAVARGASVAVVLSRVNHLAHATVSTHLRELLRAEGLGAAPLFVIEESELKEHGLLPDPAIRSLRMWTSQIAASPAQRATIVEHTLTGALASIDRRIDTIVDASHTQREAVSVLRAQVSSVFTAAGVRLQTALEDGVLFRGDVVGRWQEYAGNGGLVAILEARAGTKNGVLTGAASIRAARVRAGLVGGVVRLFTAIADEAAAELLAAWQQKPGGAAAGSPELARASGEAGKTAEDAARYWLDEVDAAVARADGSVRASAMPVLVAAALQEGALPVGREVDVAGGTVTLSADLLSDVFEDDDVRSAARIARSNLLGRLLTALATEERRFTARLDQVEPPANLTAWLRDAGREIERQRGRAAALFADPPPQPAGTTTESVTASEPESLSATTVEPVITDVVTPAGAAEPTEPEPAEAPAPEATEPAADSADPGTVTADDSEPVAAQTATREGLREEQR